MNRIIYIVSDLNTRLYEFNDEASLTEEWIRCRINIFMNYTLKSLKIQTNQNFIARIKYNDKTQKIVEQVLGKYDELPNNVKFIKESEFDDELKENIKKYDYLYWVNLDSDDAYHKTWVQQLYEYKPKVDTIALINKYGYLYDSINKRIAQTVRSGNPFFTLIYKVKEYLDGFRYDLTPLYTYDINEISYEFITMRSYMQVAHSDNTSGKDNQFGNLINDSEIKNVLAEFIGNTNLIYEKDYKLFNFKEDKKKSSAEIKNKKIIHHKFIPLYSNTIYQRIYINDNYGNKSVHLIKGKANGKIIDGIFVHSGNSITVTLPKDKVYKVIFRCLINKYVIDKVKDQRFLIKEIHNDDEEIIFSYLTTKDQRKNLDNLFFEIVLSGEVCFEVQPTSSIAYGWCIFNIESCEEVK